MQTDKFSRFLKNYNPILLWSYLDLISVIACSKTVHNITQTKFKLLVYVQSGCTKIIRHCNKYIKIEQQRIGSGLWLQDCKKLGLRLRMPSDNDEICCYEIQNQPKHSIARRETWDFCDLVQSYMIIGWMYFVEICRADITGGCWPLLTIMLLSWLRTICVLLLSTSFACERLVNFYKFCLHVY